jgi:hypothetical protein
LSIITGTSIIIGLFPPPPDDDTVGPPWLPVPLVSGVTVTSSGANPSPILTTLNVVGKYISNFLLKKVYCNTFTNQIYFSSFLILVFKICIIN